MNVWNASSETRAPHRLPWLSTTGLLAGVLLGILGGCSTDLDTYFDPSKVGRFEHTPTAVPILDRITTIEGPGDEFVEPDKIRAEDLRPEASEYRIHSGDSLEVRIWDIISPGVVETYQLLVDTRGSVTIPQLGEFNVNNLTAEQMREKVAKLTSKYVRNPLVQVTVAQSRKQTFTVLGAVSAPGSYFIPSADYRLLEAITAAGGIAESTPNVYIIRQIPLDTQPTNTDAATSTEDSNSAAPSGENLIDLIDNLAGNGSDTNNTTHDGNKAGNENKANDTDNDKPDAGGSPGMMQPADTTGSSRQPEKPTIDLVEGDAKPSENTQTDTDTNAAWIFFHGKWVRTATADTVSENGEISPDSIITQRVIEVPVKPLLMGDARYNIVVRPGDVVRVPQPQQGFIYLSGEVNRPGSYNLPSVGPYTLHRAIISAGNLSSIGVPERCDLTRMIGTNRQATIMLNYRAIVEGTQPDIVLKPNDIINVGTTFWAFPLAVFRNGFRTSYGFGFLLDRNFGNDVFGAPPTNFTR